MSYRHIFAAASLAFVFTAHAGDSPAPAGASVRIISPADGASVESPFKVVFGLSGMGVAPAGTVKDGTGHHHLIINTKLPAANAGIPADDNHVHFGKGQTEAMVKLAPGKHTLQLLMGDFKHVPHAPAVASEQITITVK